MANDELLRILWQGVEAWNAWRKENPNACVDLSMADLKGTKLSEVDLRKSRFMVAVRSGAQLGKANFKGANLAGADLRMAYLASADLTEADLRRADLSGAILTGAKLSRAKITGANFSKAYLNQANLDGVSGLSRANLSGSRLFWVDLQNFNLRGAKLYNANFGNGNLSGADLSEADLRKANLTRARLPGANFTMAKLVGAKFGKNDIGGACFCGADLINVEIRKARIGGANLSSANMTEVDLSYANLFAAKLDGSWLERADLRSANLGKANLEGANLTGVKLWETQRADWLIKNVICRQAFWDRDSCEPTDYEDGEFERIFAEKPRILLRYPGGLSAVDLALLPLMVERLQADHPSSKLSIRSMQDDAGGASVTITVEDLNGRNAEALAGEVETMRETLTTIQHRLRSEESLRLAFEAKYQTMICDVLPRLLDRTPTRQQIHIGHITGPTVIEGIPMSGDTYHITGQAGAVGRGARSHANTFQQVRGGLDLPRLAEELAQLRTALRIEGTGEPEEDVAIGTVAAAETAAKQGDERAVLRHLRAASTWTLGIAEKIGVPVAVEVLKRAVA